MPLIIGGGVGVVLIAIIAVVMSRGGGAGKGGGGGGGGAPDSPAKTVAARYLDAWKSGSADAIAGMEALTPAQAATLLVDIKSQYEQATSSTHKPTEVRGKVKRSMVAMNELGDITDWDAADKVGLVRKIVGIAYKAYFTNGVPPMTYEIKSVEGSGDQVTVRVSIKTDCGSDYPELVPLETIARSGALKLVRAGSSWAVVVR